MMPYLPPALRFGGVVYWCPARFPDCVSPFPASRLFSLSREAAPSSPARPLSRPSSRSCQNQLYAQDQATFLGRQTSHLPLALRRCCCLSGCEEMGQYLTAEESVEENLVRMWFVQSKDEIKVHSLYGRGCLVILAVWVYCMGMKRKEAATSSSSKLHVYPSSEL